MSRVEKTFEWCLEKGKVEKRKHKGLRKIESDVELSKEHVEKSTHNLNFMKEIDKMGKYDDWIFSAGFYAMYHACLAILYYFGYESQNQECTFTVIEKLIGEGKIDLDMEYVKKIRSMGEKISETADVKGLREDFQYGTKVKAEEELKETTMKLAEEFVLKVKGIVYSFIGEI